MAKFGLSVLEEELISTWTMILRWTGIQKEYAVEVTLILSANSSNVETIDDKGEVSDEDAIFEDYVLFTIQQNTF